ncbi:MAG: PspA-associated protein PspAB [Streptosporangiaceae bacterium]
MGFLDVLFGRSKPIEPNLDRLFGVPSAAVTLEAALGLAPTGTASVCVRAAEGKAFADVEREVRALLGTDGPPVEQVTDAYDYTWLVVRRDPGDLAGLVGDVHTVNVSLQDAGFGPFLLCTLIGFADGSDGRLGLVYLYKRGTFYPFVPLGGQRRDNAGELEIRGHLEGELPVESDLRRWFAVWGAPGL